MGRAVLQSEAMDGDAVGRSFCSDGRAPTAGGRYSCILLRFAVMQAFPERQQERTHYGVTAPPNSAAPSLGTSLIDKRLRGSRCEIKSTVSLLMWAAAAR